MPTRKSTGYEPSAIDGSNGGGTDDQKMEDDGSRGRRSQMAIKREDRERVFGEMVLRRKPYELSNRPSTSPDMAADLVPSQRGRSSGSGAPPMFRTTSRDPLKNKDK